MSQSPEKKLKKEKCIGCTTAIRSIFRNNRLENNMCGSTDMYEAFKKVSIVGGLQRSSSLPPPYTPGNSRMSIAGPQSPEIREAAKQFITFLNRSMTPFHAVFECKERLVAAGFEELSETGAWDIKPKKKYFVTKNRSAIMAFAVGAAYKPGNGYSIVVGHTDSPCLRVKPISKQKSEEFLQVGCSTYGGGIWRTWFDRDLSVAGEVVVKQNDTLSRKLINLERPILFIPNLAIHLETDRKSFTCNPETQLRPLLESCVAANLGVSPPPSKKAKVDEKSGDEEQEECDTDAPDPRDITAEHQPHFLELVASAANVAPKDLVDLDLYLYDTNPAQIAGMHEEFICGARLDNLVGTYTAIQGLLDSLADGHFETSDGQIRMAACFDNEEVGSQTAMGAQSSFTEYVLRRLSGNATGAFEQAIGRSMLISADQAHAAHPNYPEKHEQNHRPRFHKGVVVKVNVNQRYATTSTTHSVLKQIASEAGVPLQKMIVRNDSPCGSTVGPILSAKLGLQTIDVGCPQLAMHSIREFSDTSSIHLATKLYSTFFSRLPDVLQPML